MCRVVGTVVGAVHHPAYDGHKLLVVEPLDERGQPAGASFLAVDTVQAGIGDRVLVNQEGNGAGQILLRHGTPGGIPKGERRPPIRSLIVGVIDRVDLA
ncbi:MAG TPA: EutN/CcmL family microcompartment protein [Polyangia bacterium]|nr:EutN/CcmL family microcompartment protein [Polyangia bacterium]